ncbi:hypothetical protein Tco_0396907 [Tanacetum coccineum]
MDSQYFKDKALLMEAKEKGDVLDAEAEAFLADVECTAPYDQPQALTTTNMFQANHEDAYDSDVDEGPNAAVAFMANLSSTSAANSQVNEVHSNDNPNFDNVDYQLSQEMHQDEHLDSDAETEIDDNTIPYHQYLLDTEAQNVPTEVSADTSDKVSMIAILTDLQTQLEGHAKSSQVNAAFHQFEDIIKERTTQKPDYVSEWCYDYAKQFVEQQPTLELTEFRLKDTITSLRIQLDGLKVEHVSLQRRYDELTKANTHSRTANTEKLSALTAENTMLKAQVTGKTCSGPSTSETPKVLAPGMYDLGSKYVPPPKRVNWAKPTPLPKKKQVTFSEPLKPSLKPPQKPVVHPNKQTNVCVPMSTGVKPTFGASKTVPKRAPRNHSSLPAKSAIARRVEAHPRTLNKKNRVDSNLLVKHSVFVSHLNNGWWCM